ncbi:MAG TPA: hypothetical protein IGR64_05820 [Leptolyngbyaceae cyanobacterium M65_K2018_010]|nr:hypothetical protein [Leptolyngbyaceae cyanobacterium M65_K2018_010]
MKPRDPNFPKEIPAIPEPHPGATPASSESSAYNPTRGEDGSPPAAAPPPQPQGPRPEVEIWTELDEAAPAQFNHPSAQVSSEPQPGLPSPSVQSPRPDLTPGPSPSETAQTGPSSAYDGWVEEEIPYQPKELGIIDQLLLLLADGAAVWRRLVRWVRSLLPPNLQRQLSEDGLTLILIGLLILSLVVWNPLGRRRAEPAAQLEPAPPAKEVVGPEATGEWADSPTLAQPSASETVAIAATEPSPEANLIAEIQAQVSQMSRAYTAGLIQSVAVNLPEHSITVNLDETWYGLVSAQQDRVAQEIYERTRHLGFQTLRLSDPEANVVARNPVVGATMVILQRHRPGEVDPLAS